VKKTRQNKEIEPPFRFNRNGKGSSREKAPNISQSPQLRQRRLHLVAAMQYPELAGVIMCPV
jgi:hypothetical protein